MKKLMFLMLGIGLMASAELLKNPNENTLWMEDGKNIELDATDGGRKGWLSTEMEISTTPATEEDEAFFTFKSPDTKKHATRRHVPMKKEYPWLEFQILSYVPDSAKYLNFWCGMYGNSLMFIHTPKPGIYLQNVWRSPKGGKANGIFDLTNYGYEINFKYIRMVKEPENYFTIESPVFDEKKGFSVGDKLIFTAKLAAEAEDVTITFFDTYFQNAVRINGQDSITLKPTNKECTEWRAECEVKSVTGFRRSTVKDGVSNEYFVFKCTVLGGKLRTPMYTNNFFPYFAK